MKHVQVWSTLSEFKEMSYRSPEMNQGNQNALQVRKLSLSWVVVQTGILGAYFGVPKWHIWFPWVQSLNIFPLIIAIFSLVFPTVKKSDIKISGICIASSGVLTDHSAMIFTFPVVGEGTDLVVGEGNEIFKLGTSIAWFWCFSFILWWIQFTWKARDNDYLRIKIPFLRLSLRWAFIQGAVLIGKQFVSKWNNWFLWMQALHIISLFLNISSSTAPRDSLARRNFVWSNVISFITSVMTYHSLTGFVFTGLNLAHLVFWPWFIVIFISTINYTTIFISKKDFQTVKRRISGCTLPFVWLFVEVGILLAKLYVPDWSEWFVWMQGFHATAFLSVAISKLIIKLAQKVARTFFHRPTRTSWITFLFSKVLVAFVAIVSYHSIMCFVFSDSQSWELFHAIFWPWIAALIFFIREFLQKILREFREFFQQQ